MAPFYYIVAQLKSTLIYLLVGDLTKNEYEMKGHHDVGSSHIEGV
jgi:hypothetical protein